MKIIFKLILSLLFLILALVTSISKPVKLSVKATKIPPPRIIRTCCTFGANLSIIAVPKVKINDITSIEKIGPHKYLGSSIEKNGLVYTRRGGFIDLGHLRDQADWTAYLYTLILTNKEKGKVKMNLGIEGGKKILDIKWEKNIDSIDAIYLAAKITYDLSVWHEISTWFGACYVPFFPERYSSFSVEDIYSNMLGVTLGIEALKSNLPYEEAMTLLLAETLHKLDVVKTENETYNALEATRNVWWSREKALPSRKVLVKHQCEAYPSASPWLVPGFAADTVTAHKISLVEYTSDGKMLNNMYELKIKLNMKMYKNPILKKYKDRKITQNDFNVILKEIEIEMENEFKT
ncbi:MAG: DUF4056 domain-containing protein [Bacteroidetes bacterium]|nr:DUF4056 domain-containing protein [Bacteroidota bacterium]